MIQKYFLYAFLFQFIFTLNDAEGMKRAPSPDSTRMTISDQMCRTRAWVPVTRPRSTSLGNNTHPRSKSVDRLREESIENIQGEAHFRPQSFIVSPPSKLRGSGPSYVDLKNNKIIIKRREKLIGKIQAAESKFQKISAPFQDDLFIGIGLDNDRFLRLEFYEQLKNEDKYAKIIEAHDAVVRLQRKFDKFQSEFPDID